MDKTCLVIPEMNLNRIVLLFNNNQVDVKGTVYGGKPDSEVKSIINYEEIIGLQIRGTNKMLTVEKSRIVDPSTLGKNVISIALKENMHYAFVIENVSEDSNGKYKLDRPDKDMFFVPNIQKDIDAINSVSSKPSAKS